MAIKIVTTITVAALLLTACAAPSQPYLDSALNACHTGNEKACSALPALQSQVQAEKNEQGRQIAVGILAGLAIAAVGASAAVAASHPAPPPPQPVLFVRPPPPPFAFRPPPPPFVFIP